MSVRFFVGMEGAVVGGRNQVFTGAVAREPGSGGV